MTMEKKNLGLGNMNGMTDQDHRTCGINDMNCLGGDCLLYTSRCV